MTTGPAPYYQDELVTLYLGDCLDILPELPDNSADAVCTDPPYALNFMGRSWDKFAGYVERNGSSRALGDDGGRHDEGYRNMRGREHEFQQWCEQWAAECLRILKPGGHLLAFGGTRTSHRLACAVEDAGFEIRDSIAWLYGSGFPKSLRVSRDERYCHCDASVHTSSRTSPELEQDDRTHTADAWDAAEDAERSVPHVTNGPLGSPGGYRSAPGSDGALPHPPVVADPASPQRQGGAPAHSRSAVPGDAQAGGPSRSPSLVPRNGHPSNQDSGHPGHSPSGVLTHTLASTSPADTSESALHRLGTALDPSPLYGTGFPLCSTCGKPQADGLGTAMKPAFEPVVCARKPLTGTVAANVLRWGTGALNIDAARIDSGGDYHSLSVPQPKGIGGILDPNDSGRSGSPFRPAAGRWPANVVLDESQAAALDQMSGESGGGPTTERGSASGGIWSESTGKPAGPQHGDFGGASRFYFTAKASTDERITHNGTAHPTVKPLSLMRWLVRLVCPPGGVILEPFAGSGTTVEAAILEGFRCIAIEREADYLPLITQRINRRRDPIAYLTAAGEDLGLFGGVA